MSINEADGSYFDGIVPEGVNYFRMPVFDRFRKLPYHRRTTRRRWDSRRLYHDMADRVIRSDIEVNSDCPEKRRESIQRLLFRLNGDVFCHLQRELMIVYAPTAELANNTLKNLAAKYSKPETPEKVEPCFYLLTAGPDGLSTEPVGIGRSYAMSKSTLELHYGADAVEFDRQLIKALRTQNSGATILRGPGGTGKTSFVRHLMSKLCTTHKFYFMPMNAMRFLSEPDVVRFWLRESRNGEGKMKRVVVLEDAEDVLMLRDADNRKQASILLNVADGLLSDFLKMHVLCTVNAPIEKLDPAVVRPGRLLAYREFKRLSAEQAMRIAAAKGITLPEQADYSLAEIYRQPAMGKAQEPTRQVGFAV
jgi:hypothetical protein